MSKNKPFDYLYLINSLVLFAADFNYLKELDGPNFDIEFEIGSDFELGFNTDLLDNLLAKRKIKEDVFNELLNFKEYVLLIPDSFWTFDELEFNSIWNTVRKKANAILDMMGEDDRKYNFSIIKEV